MGIDRLFFYIDLFMLWLGDKLGWNRAVEPKNTPPDVSTDGGEVFTPPSPIPPTATLEVMCKAIKDMEGANPANNNPGNCRYFYGGYHPMYEPVGRSKGGFAIFPTYELGWLYLKNTVKGKIKNHPTWTLLDFFNNYAPESDGNNPTHYAAFVAKRLGVDSGFLMKDLVLPLKG